MEPVVRHQIEGPKWPPAPTRTLLEVVVEHPLPTVRMHGGSVGYHTVEIKKDGVVSVACNRSAKRGGPAARPLRDHWSLVDDGQVPGLQRRYAAVIAEDTQGPRIEKEMLAAVRGQPDPPC